MQVKDFHGKSVIDSREVAAMVEKRHNDLLRDIRGYVEIMENSNERNSALVGGERKIAHSDFFIPSTYMSEQNKEMPCYLITKKGCDMIANKLTGEKGVLFTTAYVTAFDEMQQALTAPHRTPEVSPGGLAKLISITRRAILDAGGTPAEVCTMVQNLYQTWNIPVPAGLSPQLPGQLSIFQAPTLDG